MACLGVHFALNNEQYKKLLSAKSDSELISILHEEIEEEWDTEWLHQTDKAWDAIHRSLTDGKLEWNNGTFPLNAVIMGGKRIHQGEDYIVTILTPEQVVETAVALKKIDEMAFKQGYENIAQEDYGGEKGQDDFEYTWAWFQGLPNLFDKAARAGRAVLFSADQ